MKTLFIPVKAKFKISKLKIFKFSKKLPKNIVIAYSIQYKNLALEIKNSLLKNHKVLGFIQVLGCSKPVFPKNTEAVLLISSGRFHAISLACVTNLPIYILKSNKLEKIPKKEIESYKNKQRAAYLRFLNAEEIGILVSIKPGQENLKKAIILKKKLRDKKSYIFIGNDINSSEFENFPIKSWINTACPRLDWDNPVINIDRLNPSN